MLNGNFKQTRTTVGVTATRLGALLGNVTAFDEITIKADTANTAVVFLGASASVTTANGYPIEAGKELKLKTTNIGSVFAISSLAGQIIHIIVT